MANKFFVAIVFGVQLAMVVITSEVHRAAYLEYIIYSDSRTHAVGFHYEMYGEISPSRTHLSTRHHIMPSP